MTTNKYKKKWESLKDHVVASIEVFDSDKKIIKGILKLVGEI